MTKLNIATLIGCLQLVKQEFTQRAALAAMGVIADDMEKLQQDRLWSAQDRKQIQRVMQALRDGLAAAQGFEPFRVPAEYIAALILGFVKPCNMRAACSWFASVSVPATDISAGAQVGASEPVSAEQLFSLITEAVAGGEETGFVARFNSKVGKEQNRAANKATPPEAA